MIRTVIWGCGALANDYIRKHPRDQIVGYTGPQMGSLVYRYLPPRALCTEKFERLVIASMYRRSVRAELLRLKLSGYGLPDDVLVLDHFRRSSAYRRLKRLLASVSLWLSFQIKCRICSRHKWPPDHVRVFRTESFGQRTKLCGKKHEVVRVYYSPTMAIQGDVAYLEEPIIPRSGYKISGPAVLAVNSRSIKVRKIADTSTRHIEECFVVSTKGDLNYFHLMIETLPQIYFSISEIKKHYMGKVPLLLPEWITAFPIWGDLFEKLCKDVEIIWVGEWGALTADIVHRVPPVASITFQGNLPYHTSDIQFDRERFIQFKNFLIDGYFMKSNTEGVDMKVYPDRIMITGSKRIPRNSNEIASLLKKYGYVECNPSLLTPLEQFLYFSNATHIWGYTGAAFANLVFACPSTFVNIVYPQALESLKVWDLILGSPVRYTLYKPRGFGTDKLHKGGYLLDGGEVEMALKQYL